MPPEGAVGQYATSYNLDVALRLDIEEMITQLSPFDAPFLGTYNGLENTPVPSILPQGEVTQIQYDWLEDELLTPRGNVEGAPLAGATSISLEANQSHRFQVDDLIRILTGTGYTTYRITAIDYSTDALTVAVWDGPAGAITDGALVEGVGTLPVEGADAGEGRATDRSRLHNFTQIFGPYPVEMSETEQVIAKYGVPNEWAHQTAKRVKEATIAQEQAIIYGVRKNDAATKRRSMGGLDYFISATFGATVHDAKDLTGATGEANLRALQQEIYSKGGDPRLLVVGPAQKPKVSDWRKSDIRYQQTENKRGQVVTSFESDFNVIDVLMHRWLRDTDGFLFNSSQAEVCTLTNRGLKWVKTAKTGDRDKAYVISERGFKFRGARHAGKFTNLVV